MRRRLGTHDDGKGLRRMPNMSGASTLAGARPPHAAGAARPGRPAGDRLRSVVGQLNAFVWGESQPALPASSTSAGFPTTPPSDARRRAEIARIAGPVAAGAHPAPAPSVDRSAAVAHYGALAEQIARERRSTGALRAPVAMRDAGAMRDA